MKRPSSALIREYRSSDQAEWLRMRKALWPDSDEAEAAVWASRDDAITLVAERPGGSGLAGFAEVGTRIYADGCDTSPVGFLEAWYVEHALRSTGIGTSLVQAAILWAKKSGFHELASDSLLDNSLAHIAHLSVGFQEVERSIKYCRRLK